MELKKVKQKLKTKEFIQEFREVAKGSRYEI